MKKSARTGAGTQRWKCTTCQASTTAAHPASPAGAEHTVLGELIDWATGAHSQAQAAGGGGDRAFRR